MSLFQAVGSFIDPQGRTVYYDAAGTHSLQPGSLNQQESATALPQSAQAPQAPGLAITSGLSPEQQKSVATYIQANLNNPQGVIQAMQQFGVNVNDAAQAIGVAPTQFASWLTSNGASAGFGGYNPTSTDYMVGFGKEAAGQALQTPTQAAMAAPNVVAGPFNGTAMQQVQKNYDDAAATGQKYVESIREQAKTPAPSMVQSLFSDSINWNNVKPFQLVEPMKADWANDVKINFGPETIKTPAASSAPATTSGGLLTGDRGGNGGGTAGQAPNSSYWGLYDFADSIASMYPEEAAKLKAFAESQIAKDSARAQTIGGTANTLGAAGNVPANPMAADPASVAAAKEAANAAARGTGVTAGGNGYGGGGNYGYGGTGSTGDRD